MTMIFVNLTFYETESWNLQIFFNKKISKKLFEKKMLKKSTKKREKKVFSEFLGKKRKNFLSIFFSKRNFKFHSKEFFSRNPFQIYDLLK